MTITCPLCGEPLHADVALTLSDLNGNAVTAHATINTAELRTHINQHARISRP